MNKVIKNPIKVCIKCRKLYEVKDEKIDKNICPLCTVYNENMLPKGQPYVINAKGVA